MKRQTNTTQMKEKTRNREVQINEEEIGKLLEKEFIIITVKMIKSLENKTQQHPTTSSTLCRIPHLNNKQNKNTNPIISRQDYYIIQPCQSEEKQTNKNSAQISPYTKLTQATGPTLGGKKKKRKKEFNLEAWEKETSNTIS